MPTTETAHSATIDLETPAQADESAPNITIKCMIMSNHSHKASFEVTLPQGSKVRDLKNKLATSDHLGTYAYATKLFQGGNEEALKDNSELTELGENPEVFALPERIETGFMTELSGIISKAIDESESEKKLSITKSLTDKTTELTQRIDQLTPEIGQLTLETDLLTLETNKSNESLYQLTLKKEHLEISRKELALYPGQSRQTNLL